MPQVRDLIYPLDAEAIAAIPPHPPAAAQVAAAAAVATINPASAREPRAAGRSASSSLSARLAAPVCLPCLPACFRLPACLLPRPTHRAIWTMPTPHLCDWICAVGIMRPCG